MHARHAFTLIELLIVVVILSVLMTIVFRLAGIGGVSNALNTTVARMQRLENALSGYYAAYGSYPPVPLQGSSRNIYSAVNQYGIQGVDDNGGDASDISTLEWANVNAACRAQPVAAMFPFASGLQDYVAMVSDTVKAKSLSSDRQHYAAFIDRVGVFSRGFDSLAGNSSRFNAYERGSSRWNDIQLFRFGLMSFLLPRYLFMMGSDINFYQNGAFAQWSSENSIPCRIIDGVRYSGWTEIKRYVDNGTNSPSYKALAAMPSQRVCARWMPNLEGIVLNGRVFYGVDTAVKRNDGRQDAFINGDNPYMSVFKSGNGQQYVLDSMTVTDGWGNEFYYYSAPPYQSYRLWSAGPDKRTFAPWVSLDTLSTSDAKTAAAWMKDDVIYLSN